MDTVAAKRPKRSRTYRSWEQMKRRCSNPKCDCYDRYGGRGITFDPRWALYAAFLDDMGERPEGTSLDRIDNNGPYCKANCKWSSAKEQANNRSTTRSAEHQGITKTNGQWCADHGVTRAHPMYQRYINRLHRGWSVVDTFNTPFKEEPRIMKIYVAGPMRGIAEFNFPAFHTAAAALRAQGHFVFSPAEKDNERHGTDISKDNPTGSEELAAKQHGFSLRAGLGVDLGWICSDAEAIAVLPGWENSKGALAEMAAAHALGLEVMDLKALEVI